ncbi:hypothetical protein MMC13_008104 [Lambiella insularis]|nr:hypothetical protein [Lambiella insularis]
MASEGEREDYTVPDDYDNLDEVAGPSPVENPDEQKIYRHSSLEQSRSNSRNERAKYRRQDSLEKRQARTTRTRDSFSTDAVQNLTEVAGPPPVDSGDSSLSTIDDSSPPSAGKSKEQEQASNNRPPPRRERASKLATQVYTVSYLIFFSLLGTLARLGLQAITVYPGAPIVTGVLWANFAGSLFMGILSEDRKLFREEWGPSGHNNQVHLKGTDEEKLKQEDLEAAKKGHGTVKKTIPLYIGLATGFCGSFTSFSSFIRDVFLALSNSLTVPVSQTTSVPVNPSSIVSRNGGYSVMALLAVILVTITLSLGGLQFGAHLAIALEPYTPSIPSYVCRKIIDRFIVFLAFGAWLGAIFLAIWPPDRPGGPSGHGSWAQEKWRGEVLFALVFAPLGCLLRFYASLRLNARIASFPLGTFVVNVFGTAMLGMFYDLQHAPLAGASYGSVGGGMVGCQVLQGFMDGFCGCLTTVSTWVSELKGLRRRHAYVYGSLSVLVSLGLLVVIMGGLKWSVGFSAPIDFPQTTKETVVDAVASHTTMPGCRAYVKINTASIEANAIRTPLATSLLKHLAKQKFGKFNWQYWSHMLSDIIVWLYNATPDPGHGLRDALRLATPEVPQFALDLRNRLAHKIYATFVAQEKDPLQAPASIAGQKHA